MDNAAQVPQKKQLLSPQRFLFYWVLLHFGISLFGQLIWIPFQHRIVDLGRANQVYTAALYTAVNCFNLLLFYNLQKHLIQRFFHFKLNFWVIPSIISWIVMYGIWTWLYLMIPQDIEQLPFVIWAALTTFIFLIPIYIQAWLLRKVIQFSVLWITLHMLFVFITILLEKYTGSLFISIYVVPITIPMDVLGIDGLLLNLIPTKFVAALLGLVTGLLMIWFRRQASQVKLKIQEAPE